MILALFPGFFLDSRSILLPPAAIPPVPPRFLPGRVRYSVGLLIPSDAISFITAGSSGAKDTDLGTNFGSCTCIAWMMGENGVHPHMVGHAC